MDNVFLRVLENFKGALFDLLWLAPVILISLTVHEYAHGRVAYALGDPTAKNSGRLSLNPIRHLDPLGTFFLLVFRFGWAKPVPVNPMYFKKRKRDMSLVSLAGPVSNILLAFVSLLMYKTLVLIFADLPDYLVSFLIGMIFINAGLAIFNLIPMSPLDGSKIFISILPDRYYYTILRYEKYGQILILLLLFTGILTVPLAFMRDGLVNLLDSVTTLMLSGVFFVVSKIFG